MQSSKQKLNTCLTVATVLLTCCYCKMFPIFQCVWGFLVCLRLICLACSSWRIKVGSLQLSLKRFTLNNLPWWKIRCKGATIIVCFIELRFSTGKSCWFVTHRIQVWFSSKNTGTAFAVVVVHCKLVDKVESYDPSRHILKWQTIQKYAFNYKQFIFWYVFSCLFMQCHKENICVLNINILRIWMTPVCILA